MIGGAELRQYEPSPERAAKIGAPLYAAFVARATVQGKYRARRHPLFLGGRLLVRRPKERERGDDAVELGGKSPGVGSEDRRAASSR